MVNGDGSNGIRANIENINRNIEGIHEDMNRIEDRVHSIETKGCAYKSIHENATERIQKEMNEQRKDIQELKMAGTKVGIYVGIIVAIIGMLAQALIRLML